MKNLKVNSKIIFSCSLLMMTSACAKLTFTPVPVEVQDIASIAEPTPNKTIMKTEVVAYGNKQVDFLLVLDDSNSMLPELKKLSARMSTFVTSLDASNIDWQICLTTTRGVPSGGPTLQYGAPLNWNNYTPASGTPVYLLKRDTPNLNTIFTSTIDSLTIGGGASGDERAIKATHDNFLNANTHNCYRPGAAISVITISDEDERSVGGKSENVKSKDSATALQALESDDLPQTMLAQAKSKFGQDVRLTFNSIIVKPGDTSCEAEQDKDTSPSHAGHVYTEASQLTDGGVGSICDGDYGGNLNTFKDKIVNSLAALNLDCSADSKTLEVKVEGIKTSQLKLEGKTLKFAYPLIEGTKIDLKYDCLD